MSRRIIFPKGWDKGKTKMCQICLRDCIENGKGKDEIIYYGGVGSLTCDVCERYICPIHFINPKKICVDCNEKKNGEEKYSDKNIKDKCDICLENVKQNRPKTYKKGLYSRVCPKCGKKVCNVHYSVSDELCLSCLK